MAFAVQLSVAAAAFLLLLLQGPLLVVFLVFLLAAMAIFVDDARPIAAIGLSLRVLKRSFWSSLGLLVLSATILMGFPVVWRVFMGHPLGMVVAIVGNAYVGTGLAAATMVFYRDRASGRVRGSATAMGA
jgi:hypothetical protein